MVLLCSVRVHTGMPITKVILPFITKSSFTGIFLCGVCHRLISFLRWLKLNLFVRCTRKNIFTIQLSRHWLCFSLLRSKSNSVRWWWFLEYAFHNLLKRFSWIMCCWKTTFYILVDIIVQTSCFRASSFSREKLSKVLLLTTRGHRNIAVKNSKECFCPCLSSNPPVILMQRKK